MYKEFILQKQKMTPVVFQAFIYLAEFKNPIKLDCCTDKWIIFLTEIKNLRVLLS